MDKCSGCGGKLGYFRYNPKKEWNLDGQLCKTCFDAHHDVMFERKISQFQIKTKFLRSKWYYLIFGGAFLIGIISILLR